MSILVTPTVALAWKPTTHVYIAEEALRDALDDGVVSIPILKDGVPQVPPVYRNYLVDPNLLRALRGNTSQYRAGVMGPDAYPDIFTGQQVIHPAHDDHLADDKVVKGSNDWLEYLWQVGLQAPDDATKAFIVGYLTHAAGDMFGHTFVNAFSGGPFTFNPHTNVAKHLVIESYVGKRTPRVLKWNAPVGAIAADYVTSGTFNKDYPNPRFLPSGDFSLDGVDIDRHMVTLNLRPDLRNLYLGRVPVASVPFIYGELRTNLLRHIAWYEREKTYLQDKRKSCRRLDVFCATKYNILLAVHKTAVWATKQYAESWTVDVRVGFEKWPELSHDLALQLIYPSNDGDPGKAGISPERYARAKSLARDYLPQLLKMSGAPDDGVKVLNSVLIWADRFFQKPKLLSDLQDDILDWMILSATNTDRATWIAYVSNPERVFDRVMGSPVTPTNGVPGTTISLSKMNQDELHLPLMQNGSPDLKYDDPRLRFSIDTFNPAYNTLIMSKLILLSPAEFARFVRDLPFKKPLPPGYVIPDNAMLGYVSSLDGRKDRKNPRVASLIFGDCTAYNTIFKPQTGDEECTPQPVAVPLDPTNLVAVVEPDKQVSLTWDFSVGATFYQIERATPPGPFAVLDTFDGTVNKIYNTTVLWNTTYTYRVKAKNANGSSPGAIVTITMPNPP